MPGSEMVVSRAAYSDNTSKYFVDGKKSSRTDVEELLASKGIDLENNRFLILQVRHRRRSLLVDLQVSTRVCRERWSRSPR